MKSSKTKKSKKIKDDKSIERKSKAKFEPDLPYKMHLLAIIQNPDNMNEWLLMGSAGENRLIWTYNIATQKYSKKNTTYGHFLSNKTLNRHQVFALQWPQNGDNNKYIEYVTKNKHKNEKTKRKNTKLLNDYSIVSIGGETAHFNLFNCKTNKWMHRYPWSYYTYDGLQDSGKSINYFRSHYDDDNDNTDDSGDDTNDDTDDTDNDSDDNSYSDSDSDIGNDNDDDDDNHWLFISSGTNCRALKFDYETNGNKTEIKNAPFPKLITSIDVRKYDSDSFENHGSILLDMNNIGDKIDPWFNSFSIYGVDESNYHKMIYFMFGASNVNYGFGHSFRLVVAYLPKWKVPLSQLNKEIHIQSCVNIYREKLFTNWVDFLKDEENQYSKKNEYLWNRILRICVKAKLYSFSYHLVYDRYLLIIGGISLKRQHEIASDVMFYLDLKDLKWHAVEQILPYGVYQHSSFIDYEKQYLHILGGLNDRREPCKHHWKFDLFDLFDYNTLPFGWRYQRLIWIGLYKNDDNQQCFFKNVGKDIVQYILTFFTK